MDGRPGSLIAFRDNRLQLSQRVFERKMLVLLALPPPFEGQAEDKWLLSCTLPGDKHGILVLSDCDVDDCPVLRQMVGARGGQTRESDGARIVTLLYASPVLLESRLVRLVVVLVPIRVE